MRVPVCVCVCGACVCVCVPVCVCVCVCVCVRVRVPVCALRIVSRDKIWCFKNTFVIIIKQQDTYSQTTSTMFKVPFFRKDGF